MYTLIIVIHFMHKEPEYLKTPAGSHAICVYTALDIKADQLQDKFVESVDYYCVPVWNTKGGED